MKNSLDLDTVADPFFPFSEKNPLGALFDSEAIKPKALVRETSSQSNTAAIRLRTIDKRAASMRRYGGVGN
jgi:hypothetical protein